MPVAHFHCDTFFSDRDGAGATIDGVLEGVGCHAVGTRDVHCSRENQDSAPLSVSIIAVTSTLWVVLMLSA